MTKPNRLPVPLSPELRARLAAMARAAGNESLASVAARILERAVLHQPEFAAGALAVTEADILAGVEEVDPCRG